MSLLTVLRPLGVAAPERVQTPYWGVAQKPADESLSSTSLTVGTGSKTLVTYTNMSFSVGQAVRVVDAANTANFMEGTVTSYNATTGSLVVLVTSIGGSGTISNWIVQNVDAGLYGNCLLWVDASRHSSFALNGTSVVQWSDISGNGAHLVQSSGALQPTRSTLKNNLPVVRFASGTSQAMSNSAPTVGQSFTTVMVFSTGTGTGTWYTSSSNTLAFWSNTNLYNVAANTQRTFATPSMSTRWYGWQVAIVFWNGASTQLSVTDATGTVTATVPATPGTNGLDSLTLGGTARAARSADMDVAEMRVYSGALTTDNTTSIIRSLRTKWGIV